VVPERLFTKLNGLTGFIVPLLPKPLLDRGSIVEQGIHEDLMKQEGLYYHLAQQQLNL
jgi:hypothetical protein